VIRELDKPEFNPLKRLLGSSVQFPEARSVLEGNNPGWVFVDGSTEPSTALVWAKGIQGFYLVGDERNPTFLDDLDACVDQVIAPRLLEMGLEWFEVSGSSKWDPVIEGVFGKRGLERGLQMVYWFDPFNNKPVPFSETNYEIRQVGRRLVDETPLGNQDFLLSKICSFWEDIEAFLKLGLGYALVLENEIVSVCFSGFVSQAVQVIDIETLEKHRRMGYAEAVGRAFMDACLGRGLEPYWDCMAENLLSRRLAEKLGFTKRDEYALYSFQLHETEAGQ
jgi:RimJ/RimL family protein N-acetyltransferase